MEFLSLSNLRSHLALIAAMVAIPGALVACAPGGPPPSAGLPTGYEMLEQTLSERPDFETPPTNLDPAEVLPKDLLQGAHHAVRSIRIDHGFMYIAVLDSDFGQMEVTSLGLLRKRVHELEALAEIEKGRIAATRLYAYSVANAVSEPVEGTLQILRHPVRTVVNVPRSAWASFQALREMKELGRTHLEDDYVNEFVGLSGEKREWAERLGVDPYSTNPFLQSALTRKSLLSLAGDITVSLATIPIPAGAGSIALSVLGATSGMNEQLDDVAPEDIRVSTRSWLRDELHIEGELAEQFLEHPWYSPTRQAIIIRSLSRLDGTAHLEEFISMATRADEPHETYAFARLAMLLAEYHERRAKLDEIFVTDGLLMAHTVDGDAVLPLYLDYAFWTQKMADSERDISRFLSWDRQVGRKHLLVSGKLSARARSELSRRRWRVLDGLEQQWLAELDEATYEPAGPDEGRILPEIGLD